MKHKIKNDGSIDLNDYIVEKIEQHKLTVSCNSVEQKNTLSKLIRLLAAETGKNQADVLIEKLEERN